MKNLIPILLILSFLGLFVLGCTSKKEDTGLPNPASQYCEKQGYTLSIIKDAQGNEYGICKFDDGSECDEWDYFNGKCKPGDTNIAVPVNKDQCDSLGGVWGKAGMAGIEQCNLPTKDSGKSCTDGSQCQAGLCIAKSDGATVGECPSHKLNFGCMNIVENSKFMGICID
jgi:putative hemolysin